MRSPPPIHLHNHQGKVTLSLPRLRRQLEAAVTSLGASAKRLPPAIEISFVTPGIIARVHADFMDDATPTDVITFHHGEILVCPEVARASAKERGLPVHREVLLYGIHGLLHLIGYTDKLPAEAAKMAKRQEKILASVSSIR